MYIGEEEITSMKVNDEEVVAIYLGETEIYSADSEPDEPCSNWEQEGFGSWEDCMCQRYGEYCPDPCASWEENGYGSWEDCRCQSLGENCGDACADWEGQGYGSWEECNCMQMGGIWDSENQECTYPEEPPAPEDPCMTDPACMCATEGGVWDDENQVCNYE